MKKINESIADYYDKKIIEHGPTPNGVDWKNDEAQVVRLRELMKIIGSKEKFSILDVGCGYGKLYELLQNEFVDFEYTGIDHSREQIRIAQSRHQNNSKVKFKMAGSEINEKYDYVVASGVFNLIFATPQEWMAHVKNEMRSMFDSCKKMFACNFLTSYSDAENQIHTLFYPQPEDIFTFAAQELSSKLVLVHDYGLYDFTLIVKK